MSNREIYKPLSPGLNGLYFSFLDIAHSLPIASLILGNNFNPYINISVTHLFQFYNNAEK